MKVGYAVLYENGTLTISKDHTILQKPILENYGEFEDTDIPWKNESDKIKTVQILSQVKSNCMRGWFNSCRNLTTLLDFQNLDVSDCKDFSYTFSFCFNLNSLAFLKDWNVSNGVDFKKMFMKCTSLETLKGLGDWDVSNGENFYGMFWKCENLKSLTSLQNWNISKGVNFTYMFWNCQNLIVVTTLSKWKFKNIDEIYEIFSDCTALKLIELPNILKNLNLDMFRGCNPKLKINWNGKFYTYADLLEYQEF